MSKKEKGLSKFEQAQINLKREEMKQNERIEMKKIDFEEKKWEYDKQRDTDVAKQVKEILEGPTGRALESIGKTIGDKVRGSSSKSALKPVRVLCSNEACNKSFYADESALSVVCPHCGSILEKQTSVSPPP